METINVIGDSHCMYWSHANRLTTNYRFLVCEQHGATARGLMNPDSYSKAHQKFIGWLADKSGKLIINVGEVDCAGNASAKVHNGTSVEESVALCMEPYEEFIDKYCSKFDKVILVGSIIPSVDDPYVHKANEWRRQISLTIQERTNITLAYNDALRSMAQRKGLEYIDITHELVDSNTGVMDFNRWCRARHDNHIKPQCAEYYLIELEKVI